MKAAIYARYSSDNQNPDSCKDQIAACRKWAAENGHIVAEERIYSDEAISGRCPSRPGIDAMIAAAKAKCFEALLVFTTDRLGRDLYSSLGVLNTLDKYDISLFLVGESFVVNDAMTRCLFSFKAMFAEMQSETNRTHTIRGQEAAIRKGYVASSLGYGYKTEKVGQRSTDNSGRVRAEGSKAVIIEEEARVIRRVFQDFADRKSIVQIVQTLNDEHVPSYHGNKWSESTISKMLRNEKFIGKYIWRKTSNKRDRTTGKALKRDNDESKWMQAVHPEMRIVSDDLWDAVQARRKELEAMYPVSSKNKGFKKQTKSYVEVYPDYLLSGSLKCEKCEGAFVQVSGRHHGYYGCQMAHRRHRCDCKKRIPRLKLEDRVLDVVFKKALNPRALEIILASAIKAMKNRFDYLPKQKAEKQTQLAKINREIDNYISFIAKGSDSPALAESLRKAEERRKTLKAEIESLGQAILQIPEGPSLGQIKEKLFNLKQLLETNTEQSALKLREYLGPITLKLTKDEQGKEYYIIKTRVRTFPFLFFTDKGATSLEWWRCGESNPGPRNLNNDHLQV